MKCYVCGKEFSNEYAVYMHVLRSRNSDDGFHAVAYERLSHMTKWLREITIKRESDSGYIVIEYSK